jgi:5,10-methylenetetrahydromethanopterin reductase
MSTPSIGIIFHPRFPPESLAGFARKAETAGFDELWLWDDCFLPGALTSAAIALSATRQLKVGIGLMPAAAYNPLFAAMEITTLARAFPGRILPGFGHGLSHWMAQIGAAAQSPLAALEETVTSVRRLLEGEQVTLHGERVYLDQVQMQVTPEQVPPLYVGAMRGRTLRLAGRSGDGVILTGMSSPAYVHWAGDHIRAGMAEAGRTRHRTVVYVDVKVHPNGPAARAAVRRSLAARLPWADIHLQVMGIAAEVAAFTQGRTPDEIAREMPDEWVDAFSASGTPEQAAGALQKWADAGADSLVFQPLDGDPDCLDEYIKYLMPLLKASRS